MEFGPRWMKAGRKLMWAGRECQLWARAPPPCQANEFMSKTNGGLITFTPEARFSWVFNLTKAADWSLSISLTWGCICKTTTIAAKTITSGSQCSESPLNPNFVFIWLRRSISPPHGIVMNIAWPSAPMRNLRQSTSGSTWEMERKLGGGVLREVCHNPQRILFSLYIHPPPASAPQRSAQGCFPETSPPSISLSFPYKSTQTQERS